MKLDNVTIRPDGPGRVYDDACGAAHALELAGERWALLVMRELLMGPKRFSDLRAGLPGISANVLTQRLQGLEANGIVVRGTLPPPAATPVYALTDWGMESLPIFQALGRWAARSPRHDPSLPLSAASLMLSFGTMFDAARAGDLAMRVGFAIGRETYVVAIAAGGIDAGRGSFDDVAVVVTGAATAVAAVVYGGRAIDEMVAAGALQVAGDMRVLRRFVRLFPLPPKVAPR